MLNNVNGNISILGDVSGSFNASSVYSINVSSVYGSINASDSVGTFSATDVSGINVGNVNTINVNDSVSGGISVLGSVSGTFSATSVGTFSSTSVGDINVGSTGSFNASSVNGGIVV